MKKMTLQEAMKKVDVHRNNILKGIKGYFKDFPGNSIMLIYGKKPTQESMMITT